MVELRTRKREMRGDEGNNHDKLGHQRISCASECTIVDTAVMSPNLMPNDTDTSPSKPNQASRTPDVWYLHVTSISFSSPSVVSHHLIHNSTIIAESKSSYPSVSLCCVVSTVQNLSIDLNSLTVSQSNWNVHKNKSACSSAVHNLNPTHVMTALKSVSTLLQGGITTVSAKL